MALNLLSKSRLALTSQRASGLARAPLSLRMKALPLNVRFASVASPSLILSHFDPEYESVSFPFQPPHTNSGSHAAALWQIAKDQKEGEQVEEDMKFFSEIFTEDRALTDLFGSGDEKICRAVVGKFKDVAKPAASTVRFLEYLDKTKKYPLLHSISTDYEEIIKRVKNEVDAELTVAKEPSSAELEAYKKEAAEMTSGQYDLQVKVDPNILGGYILKVGGRRTDQSVVSMQNALLQALEQHYEEPEASLEAEYTRPKQLDFKLDLPPCQFTSTKE